MDTLKTLVPGEISLRKAALIAGLGVLLIARKVPIVEFYIFPKLIGYKNPFQKTPNIANHTKLFPDKV
ncbi:MAG: hypothetical protein ACXVLT_08780 [Flavisolibacter sp.]